MKTLSIKVQCYAGYKADERPISFELTGGRRDVDEIVDRWYDVDANYFKVSADDGKGYLLRHNLDSDQWDLVLPDDTPE